MRYIVLFVLGISSVFAKSKHDPLLPKYDKRCTAMRVQHAPIDPLNTPEHVDYFNKQVPLSINQIWFGDKTKMPKNKVDSWSEYAGMNRYVHRLWTESDLAELKTFMKPANYHYLQVMLHEKNYCAASDIVRYEILKENGGIYFDCDFSPPRKDYNDVGLHQIFNLQGLTVVTEHNGRNVGETAIFVCNGILIAPDHHPVIVSAVDQIEANIQSWAKAAKNYDAMFITGPFFLNKILWGTFNVVPITYLLEFGID